MTKVGKRIHYVIEIGTAVKLVLKLNVFPSYAVIAVVFKGNN